MRFKISRLVPIMIAKSVRIVRLGFRYHHSQGRLGTLFLSHHLHPMVLQLPKGRGANYTSRILYYSYMYRYSRMIIAATSSTTVGPARSEIGSWILGNLAKSKVTCNSSDLAHVQRIVQFIGSCGFYISSCVPRCPPLVAQYSIASSNNPRNCSLSASIFCISKLGASISTLACGMVPSTS